MSGLAFGALLWAERADRAQAERMRQVRADARELAGRLSALLLSGDWLRLLHGTVRDALVGLAAAGAARSAPSTVPAVATASARPDLTSDAGIRAMTWPPTEGTYDERGRTDAPGELALAFYLIAYAEPRIALQALTLPTPPTTEQRLQLFWALQGLAATIARQDLSPAKWRAVWARLFDRAPGQRVPIVVASRGTTRDATPRPLGSLEATRDGIYKAWALCGLQRDDGAAGSLTILATLSRYRGALSCVSCDRLNAQLAPGLVGVDAQIDTAGDRIALTVTGLPGAVLGWEAHLSIYPPPQ